MQRLRHAITCLVIWWDIKSFTRDLCVNGDSCGHCRDIDQEVIRLRSELARYRMLASGDPAVRALMSLNYFPPTARHHTNPFKEDK